MRRIVCLPDPRKTPVGNKLSTQSTIPRVPLSITTLPRVTRYAGATVNEIGTCVRRGLPVRTAALLNGPRRRFTVPLIGGGNIKGAASFAGDHRHPFPSRCDVCADISRDTL